MVMVVEYNGGRGFDIDMDVRNLPPRREVLAEVSRPVAGVHARAKCLPPEMIGKALDNEAFEDFPRATYAYKRVCDEDEEKKDRFNQSYKHAAKGFLRRTFHSLTYIPGISFDIGNVSEKDERISVDEAKSRYQSGAMHGQVESLEESYSGLRALRTVFGNTGQNNCFNMEIVVPSRYLPELLVAAPVWFIQAKRKTQRSRRGANSSAIRYFCDLGVTDRFAYLFQMYNNRQRLFSEFEWRDVMPLPIVELVGKVSNLFDYLVIATPYHDIASKEWRDTQWVRNMDPFLFGFLKQIPELMFFLGRWSGTGLFPLMTDMIADTMGHISKNKGLLANFSGNEFSWYKYDIPYSPAPDFLGPRLSPSEDYKCERPIYNPTPQQRKEWIMLNHSLIKFANKILQQFECGTLFSWLRGER